MADVDELDAFVGGSVHQRQDDVADDDGVYGLLVKREGMIAVGLGELAGRLGLDMGKYETCTGNRTHREKVEADKEYGRSLGVQGTPSQAINGEQLDWYSYRNLVNQMQEHANPGTQGKDGS